MNNNNIINGLTKSFNMYSFELINVYSHKHKMVLNAIESRLQLIKGDRRYKMFILSASTNYKSLIVKFDNTKYYINYNDRLQEYKVERMA